MRTKTINLYQYSELSDEAKEKARDWFRQGNEYSWSDEFRQSLDGFCSMVGIKLRDWRYDQWRYHYTLSSSEFSDHEQELTGTKLWTYVHQRFDAYLTRAKTFRKGDKKRKSRIMREETACPFTGVCFDEDFLDPLRKLNTKLTYEDVIRECLDSGFRAVVDDIKYQNSEEVVEWTIIAYEYEFTENGERA